jgi:hypothetical protein
MASLGATRSRSRRRVSYQKAINDKVPFRPFTVPFDTEKSKRAHQQTKDFIWNLLKGPYRKTAAFVIAKARISMLSEHEHSFGTCSDEEFAERLECAARACLDIYVNVMNHIYVSNINEEMISAEDQPLNRWIVEDFNNYLRDCSDCDCTKFSACNVNYFDSEFAKQKITAWVISPFLKHV